MRLNSIIRNGKLTPVEVSKRITDVEELSDPEDKRINTRAKVCSGHFSRVLLLLLLPILWSGSLMNLNCFASGMISRCGTVGIRIHRFPPLYSFYST